MLLYHAGEVSQAVDQAAESECGFPPSAPMGLITVGLVRLWRVCQSEG